MMASKKGISSLQIGRLLGLSKKTAWFLMHRILESLPEESPLKGGEPIGGKNKVVEIDETYVGGKAANRKNHIPPKTAVLSLVERDGKVRSHRVPNVNAKTLRKVIVEHVNRASYIMTDEAAVYTAIGREFSGHGSVNHSAEEYVRAFFWHTNTVENYFSILKRGIIGVYHHTSQEHLHRYLAEFDFRYNNREGNGVSDSSAWPSRFRASRSPPDLSADWWRGERLSRRCLARLSAPCWPRSGARLRSLSGASAKAGRRTPRKPARSVREQTASDRSR